MSAPISGGYRVVGILSQPDEVVWFWIGPHEEYENVISMR